MRRDSLTAAMLCPHMFTRTLSFALALMLLLTQQLWALHSLSHGRSLPASTLMLAAGGTVTKSSTTRTDPVESEQPADGLCKVCLLLLALGAAALPAGLQWLAVRQRGLRCDRPTLPALQTRPGAPYLARAPPLRLALT